MKFGSLSGSEDERISPDSISLLIKHGCVVALRLGWPQPVSWAMMNLLMRAIAGPGALPSEEVGQQYAGYTVKGSMTLDL